MSTSETSYGKDGAPPSLQARVEREREAHSERDVLKENLQVKKTLFHHLQHDPSKKRLYALFDKHTSNVAGKRILDLGCGPGMRSIRYLKGGAQVFGIDISPLYIHQANERALAMGFSPDQFSFKVMDAHRLDYEDESFDIVAGRAILHHLDYRIALKEVHRVLGTGGTAIFVEPLADNPLLRLFRLLSPNLRTEDERPFSGSDLKILTETAQWEVDAEFSGLICAPMAVLTSIVLRPFPNNVLLRLADRLERSLSDRSILSAWHRIVLFQFVKRSV